MAKSPVKSKNLSRQSGSSSKKSSAKKPSAKKSSSGKSIASKSSGKKSELSGREDLNKLFEHSLKDMYWAEKALTKAIPKMIRNAESEALQSILEEHLGVTEMQVTKLEQVFGSIGVPARGKKCPGMEGIITEGNEIMEEFNSPAGDTAIIAAARKVEHYEISSYMAMISLADTLGMSKQSQLLKEILAEEQEADGILERFAVKLALEVLGQN